MHGQKNIKLNIKLFATDGLYPLLCVPSSERGVSNKYKPFMTNILCIRNHTRHTV
jgi:hypothetical protein